MKIWGSGYHRISRGTTASVSSWTQDATMTHPCQRTYKPDDAVQQNHRTLIASVPHTRKYSETADTRAALKCLDRVDRIYSPFLLILIAVDLYAHNLSFFGCFRT